MEKFPWSHVFGFLLSIVLTCMTIWIGLYTNFNHSFILYIIVGLAFVQALLQFFMFMHMTEGEDGKMKTANIFYGIFVAVIVVLGSLFTMSFGM